MLIGRLDDCRFSVGGGRIVLENARIRRVWALEAGVLHPVSVEDPVAGLEHGRRKTPPENAFQYQGYVPIKIEGLVHHPMRLAAARARAVRRSISSGPYLEARLHFLEPLQGLSIRWIHRVFPGVPAIRSILEVRAENFPRGPFWIDDPRRAVEALPIAPALAAFEVHEFLCRTDNHHGPLRITRSGRIPGAGVSRDGNLAILSRPDGRGLFVLKESPPREEQRPEVPCDFRIGAGMVYAMGWGILPGEFSRERHRRSYGWTVGVFSGGTEGAARAIRACQDARYPRIAARDDQCMANPWGNDRRGEGMTERFLREEIGACARLGIPICQPDDGWQKGHPFGHARRVGENLVCPPDAWTFRRDRFPRGLAPVVREARRHGVRLGLWFSPDVHRQFATWREEARVLLGLWRRFGIDVFKIDTVLLRSLDADENMDALLRTVFEESRGRVTFNLDITAGLRWGYFRNTEFGNYFLENRYVQWGNYWPWRTLRNLWQLSLFVPTRKLQIEICDVERPPRMPAPGERKIPGREGRTYSPRDPTRPAAAGQAYAAAVALFANPLVWAEAKGFSPAGRAALAPVMGLWRRIHGEVLSGQVWPIGDEPDGFSFPGFQSVGGGGRGVAVLYREYNKTARHAFSLRDVPPGRYRITPVWPEGDPSVVRLGRDPRLVVDFDHPHDARVVRYEPV